MEKIETKSNIEELRHRLQECRVELQGIGMKKSGENRFAHYKYYELADFLPLINKLFLDRDLFSNFSPVGEEATLTISYKDENEVFRSNLAEVNIKGASEIQKLGGQHTYLKRYLYLNALEIVENDFADSKDSTDTDKPKVKLNKKTLTKAQLDKLMEKNDKATFLKYLEVYDNETVKDGTIYYLSKENTKKIEEAIVLLKNN